MKERLLGFGLLNICLSLNSSVFVILINIRMRFIPTRIKINQPEFIRFQISQMSRPSRKRTSPPQLFEGRIAGHELRH